VVSFVSLDGKSIVLDEVGWDVDDLETNWMRVVITEICLED
jgi:hypothetical protein